MISLFRKHIAGWPTSRPAVRLAATAGIFAWVSVLASAQVATRTQLSTQQEQDRLTLTARVADFGGAAVSEGSVSFETPKGSLGSVFVHDGKATLNLTNPPAWARTVTAVYHGDAAHANSSASAAVTPAASGLEGFTVTANPSSLSLTPGQFGTVSLSISSQNGFSAAVNLSCSGLPGGTNCIFNPGVVTPAANGLATSAMQITTTATSGGKTGAELIPLHRSGGLYAIVIPGVLALFGLGAIRRRNYGTLRVVGLLMLLGAGVTGLTACNERYGYEHYPPTANTGSPAGNYTVVISAYSSNGTNITQATSTDANCSGAVCIALTVK